MTDAGEGDSAAAAAAAATTPPAGPSTSDDVPQVEPVATAAGGLTSRQSVKAHVKPFTKESLERYENKTVQLVREYGFQPRRKLSVEDGAVLPHKYEPFPKKLYGRPLEEIDNFIYEEAYQQYLHKRAGLQATKPDVQTTTKPVHCDGVDNFGCFQVRLYYDWFLIPGSCKCWRPDYFNKYVRRKSSGPEL